MRPMATAQARAVDFWMNVVKHDGGCWEWGRAISAAGYGMFWWEGKVKLTHRLAYEMMVGKIPAGLVLDHLCKNTKCCNPAHLEPVTQKINVYRSDAVTAKKRLQTHCIHGHSLENAIIKKDGRRDCRECDRARCAKYRAKRGNK